MHHNRIQNTLLATIAALLLFNFGVMLSSQAQAQGKIQYKVVQPGTPGAVQQLLNEESGQGWEYAGSVRVS